jgi:hypothetical protein
MRFRCGLAIAATAVLSGAISFNTADAAPKDAPPVGLPGPTAPGGWGVNIHFTDPQPGEMARFREAGYRWARMDLFWGAVERKRGVYDFSTYDRLYVHLEKSGVRPLFILDYGNDLYQKGAPTTPEARAAFARFAAAAARHFAKKPVVWEIWNEPNLGQFWQPKPDASEYAALAIDAAKAIRAADPKAAIVAPGSSGFPWEFFETMFRAGLLQHIDGVSVHPYRGTAPETAADDYARLRVLIVRYAPKGREALPIISSEWGYSTYDVGGVSEEKQAAYLCRMWLTNLASGVNLSIFYDWRNDGDDPKEAEHRFGTVARDFTPKPSFLAAKRLIADLDGFTFRHRLAGENPNDWRLLFQRGDTGDLALVTWRAEPTAPMAAQTPAVRRITSSDREYTNLRRLCSVRFSVPGGVLTEGNGRHASFVVNFLNHEPGQAVPSVSFMESGVPGPPFHADIPFHSAGAAVQPGRRVQMPVSLPLSGERREGYRVAARVKWNGEALPALAPLTVRRTDPLLISASPAAQGLQVSVENPGDVPFDGTASYEGGRVAMVLTLPKGTTRTEVTLPAPSERPFAVVLKDRQGQTVARTEVQRYAPLAGFPAAAGDSPFQEIRFVENVTQPPTPLTAVNTPVGSPAPVAVRFAYQFPKGWQYAEIAPRQKLPIPTGAKALMVWVHSDGSGDFLRARYTDSTGQTFQPDLPKLEWKGWRLIAIPLDGSGPGGHWGGANTGVPTGPLTWEGLLLIDSSNRELAHGGELLLAAPAYVFAG